MIMMENYLCMIFFNSDDEIVFKQEGRKLFLHFSAT
jgi:hypothetical protein